MQSALRECLISMRGNLERVQAENDLGRYEMKIEAKSIDTSMMKLEKVRTFELLGDEKK